MILHFRILFRSLCVGQWRRFRAYAMKESWFPWSWVWLESGILRRILIPRTYRWVWVWVVTRHVIKAKWKRGMVAGQENDCVDQFGQWTFMPRTEKEITTLTVGQVIFFFFRSQFFILFLVVELFSSCQIELIPFTRAFRSVLYPNWISLLNIGR